jgi:hypothetical protein
MARFYMVALVSCLSLSIANQTVGLEKSVGLRHGTVLLYEITANQFVVVADSKLYAEGQSQRAHNNLCCKIVNLSDDTLFFYTGDIFEAVETKTGKRIFSQQEIAKQAFQHFKKAVRSEQRLIDVANKYSELVRPRIDELLRNGIRSDGVGLAGFASLDEFNHPRAVLLNIALSKPNAGGPPQTTDSQPFEPMPDQVYTGNYPPYQQVKEFIYPQTPRGKRAAEQFASRRAKLPERDAESYWLIAAVEFSLNWNSNDPTIGPPVDAAVIESDTGIRWIRRKSMCLPRPHSPTRQQQSK